MIQQNSGIDNRRILVVDDNPSIHQDFAKVLAPPTERRAALMAAKAALFSSEKSVAAAAPFELDCVVQGEEALRYVSLARHTRRPYALAFVDVRMPPGWDGVETVQRLWQVDADLMIVLCTAFSDYQWEDLAARLSRPEQFLVLRKPFDAIEVRQLAAGLTAKWKLAKQVEMQMREVVATRDTTVFALAQLAEWRDPETGEHLHRIRVYSQLLAEELSRGGPYADLVDQLFLDDLYRASPLHDIGKVAIPDHILLKRADLTAEEQEVMRRHAIIGANTLKCAMQQTRYGDYLRMAVEVAECHHERFDGSGYPHGLAGDEIPLAARIVAVADVFDMLTSPRLNRPAMSLIDARSKVLDDAGKHFDPLVVQSLVGCFEKIVEASAQFAEQQLSTPNLREAYPNAAPAPCRVSA